MRKQMSHITELFLDDQMIDMAASVSRKIHRPTKHTLNPIIRSEKWHEGNVNIPYATLYDEEEKCFKMWLRSGWDGLNDTRIHAMTLSTDDLEPKYVSAPEEADLGAWKPPSINVGSI